jgi:hypothetical protein
MDVTCLTNRIDTQLDGLVAINPDDGSLNMVVAIFVNSYIVIVVWILLQVSVAVLLVRARACPKRSLSGDPMQHQILKCKTPQQAAYSYLTMPCRTTL